MGLEVKIRWVKKAKSGDRRNGSENGKHKKPKPPNILKEQRQLRRQAKKEGRSHWVDEETGMGLENVGILS